MVLRRGRLPAVTDPQTALDEAKRIAAKSRPSRLSDGAQTALSAAADLAGDGPITSALLSEALIKSDYQNDGALADRGFHETKLLAELRLLSNSIQDE
jgi:hypothetical protein